MNTNTYCLTIILGKRCNFNCSYCHQYQKKNNSSYPDISDDILFNFKKLVPFLTEIQKNKKIRLILIGGEPTVYPLKDILQKLNFQFNEVVIITNFSKNLDYFKDIYFFLKKSNIKLFICASYHEEYYSLDNFFKKWSFFSNTLPDVPFNIQFTLDNQNFIELLCLLKVIPVKRIQVNVKSLNGSLVCLKSYALNVWKIYNQKKFDAGIKSNILTDEKLSINSNELLSPYGLKCSVPQFNMILNERGDVFYHKECPDILPICNILNNNIDEKFFLKWLFQPYIICNKSICSCGGNFYYLSK